MELDDQATWSMDHTLAHIIVPMLKQLQDTKHGAPVVDNDDVPEELRMPEDWYEGKYKVDGSTDTHFFDRWDWVLEEMIWAFEQKVKDDWEEQFCSGEHDVYFAPVDEDGFEVAKEDAQYFEMKHGPNHTFKIDMEIS
jgi:hypothetical protein